MTPPDAPSADDRPPARRRGARVAGLAGGALLVVALAARVVATDPAQFVFAHRMLFWTCAAAAWALAFVLASPRGRRRAAAVALSVGVSLVVLEAVLRVLAGPYYAPVFRLNDTWLFEHAAAVTDHRDEALLEWPDHPDADVRLEPSSESARHKVELMAATLFAIREAAKARGVPLLLVVVPSAPDVCRGYDTDVADTTRFPEYRPDNLTRPIERTADAYGIPYVGLFGPFIATDANVLYEHGGDMHWNSTGQALAAKLTARAIVERRMLP